MNSNEMLEADAGHTCCTGSKDTLRNEILGWVALLAIVLLLVVPVISHLIAIQIYHLFNPVNKDVTNPLASDVMLLTSLVALVTLVMSSVLYFLLKKQGY